MLKYAGLFIEHLQKMNVNFSVDSGVDERGNETITRVKIPCGETNITASFFGDENGTLFCASMAVGVINPNCIKLVSEDVIALCNEFNSNNQWVKFCVRDGNSVPGLNGALICLEEAAVLVEKTAAQNAYSIVSNLIKAHAESKGSFARLLNGSPAKKENADNRPVNTSEKPKKISGTWSPILIAVLGVIVSIVGFVLEQPGIGIIGCILGGCGLGIMYKQKKKRLAEFLNSAAAKDKISVLRQMKKKEKLPTVLTWILFVLCCVIYFLAAGGAHI